MKKLFVARQRGKQTERHSNDWQAFSETEPKKRFLSALLCVCCFLSLSTAESKMRARVCCVCISFIWRIYTDCAVLTRKCLCREYTERPIQYIHTRFMLFRIMKYVLWFQVGLNDRWALCVYAIGNKML